MAIQSKSGIGIKLNKEALKILFLMFVDDCTFFCRADNRAAINIKQIFDHFFMVSGQFVNYHK